MQVVIDIGNTSTKIGFFKNRQLKKHLVINGLITQTDFMRTISNIKVEAIIVASVIPSSKPLEKFLEKKFITVSLAALYEYAVSKPDNTLLPFKNLYKTPLTLGHDRIANAAAAVALYPKTDTLIIDAGTCLKFDFVDNKGRYQGGAISPGLQMRFAALQYFTGKLPLIKAGTFNKINGATTEESIRAGVQNGIVNEVLATIDSYKIKYGKVNIILTGGDWRLFADHLKKFIFADPFFTLKGLQIILENNIKNTNA